MKEILDEVTKNTGCGHDGQMVWSSQTHGECNGNQHVIAPGGRNRAHEICPEECPLGNGPGVLGAVKRP